MSRLLRLGAARLVQNGDARLQPWCAGAWCSSPRSAAFVQEPTSSASLPICRCCSNVKPYLPKPQIARTPTFCGEDANASCTKRFKQATSHPHLHTAVFICSIRMELCPATLNSTSSINTYFVPSVTQITIDGPTNLPAGHCTPSSWVTYNQRQLAKWLPEELNEGANFVQC